MGRGRLASGLLLSVLLSGCVSLDAAHVPDRFLEPQADNGWRPDGERTTGVEGGPFSKHATHAYRDDGGSGQGYRGVLSVVSLKGVLSPDREALRERLGEALREEAQEQGLSLEGDGTEGARTLANGARSLFVVVDATAHEEGSIFTSDSTVKVIGEVFRCTGGATVVVSGSAQIDRASSIGGVTTSRNTNPATWSEIVQDPFGSIEGYTGSRGLIHNIACP